MHINEKIRLLRIAKGMSLEQLAEEIGVTKQMIFKYEKGITLPTLLAAKQLAIVFGITVDELIS